MVTTTLATKHLFGLDFVADATISDVVDWLLKEQGSPTWRCVVTPNVDHLVRYHRSPEESITAATATVVLPDGMPIVWSSRLFGARLQRRLTGADLFAALWPQLVADKTPTVVVASSDLVATRMRAAHRGVHCIVPPQFDVADSAELDRLAAEVSHAVAEIDARFVVVGVSMPKHHRIANRLRELWAGAERSPTVLLLGASPDFALGLTARAPEWMQRWSLEWLHRLVLDPRRMARRYLVDDVVFLRLIVQEAVARIRPRHPANPLRPG